MTPHEAIVKALVEKWWGPGTNAADVALVRDDLRVWVNDHGKGETLDDFATRIIVALELWDAR